MPPAMSAIESPTFDGVSGVPVIGQSIAGTPDTPSKVGISIAKSRRHVCLFGHPDRAVTALRTGRALRSTSPCSKRSGVDGYTMYYTFGGTRRPKHGASHATIAPYGPYRLRDGREVPLRPSRTTANGRHSARGCSSGPRSAVMPRFRGTGCASGTAPTWTPRWRQCSTGSRRRRSRDVLDAAQIANAHLNTVEQFIAHPQLAGRDAWREVASPVGPMQCAGSAGPHGRCRTGDGCYSRRRRASRLDYFGGARVRRRHHRTNWKRERMI